MRRPLPFFESLERHGLRVAATARNRVSHYFYMAGGAYAVDLARVSQPDVVVLDYQMPRLNGSYVIAQIRDVSPKTRIVVYSANDSDGVRDACLRAGAVAFVSKNAKIDPLIAAIRDSMSG